MLVGVCRHHLPGFAEVGIIAEALSIFVAGLLDLLTGLVLLFGEELHGLHAGHAELFVGLSLVCQRELAYGFR
ncbi:MAG: hypothetical protein WC119_09195 [Synergistaceae bacterium]